MGLIEISNVNKIYQVGEVQVQALKNITCVIGSGVFAAFVGPSGSGKSTMLNLIGCLDKPTSGTLRVVNTNISELNRKELAAFRAKHLGFIFQDFNLIPVLSVYENVEYPLLIGNGTVSKDDKSHIMEILDAVGMADQKSKLPSQISGGQKQRAAVARALVTRPKLVLADEPTANLDHETAFRIIDLMKLMRSKFQTTFIFSTHDPKVMQAAEVIFNLEDGILSQSDSVSTQNA